MKTNQIYPQLLPAFFSHGEYLVKKLAFLSFVLFLSLAVCSVSYGNPEPKETSKEPYSFIVKYKRQPGIAKTNIGQLMNQLGMWNDVRFKKIKAMASGAYVVSLDEQELVAGSKKRQVGLKKRVDEVLEDLNSRPEIEYAVLNTRVYMKASLQVTHADQWDELPPPTGIDTERAWKITQGNPDTVVAVIDSGIADNEDLNKNILPAYSFARRSIDNKDAGINSSFHGTHVAGTIAANGNILGIAPKVKILPVDVFGDAEYAELSDIIDAIYWVAGQPVAGAPELKVQPKVINMSIGGDGYCNKAYQEAIQTAINKNITIVVAAGNENENVYNSEPANCPGVISVAATNRYGRRAFYSNYGERVSIAAPGGEAFVRKTDPNGILSTIKEDYAFMIGTSMASPHVAGIAALMYSEDPSLTPQQVKEIISRTASPFPNGMNDFSCSGYYTCGVGLANAGSAVETVRAFKQEKELRANRTT